MTVTEIAVEKNIPFYILIRNTWEKSNQIGYSFLLHKKKGTIRHLTISSNKTARFFRCCNRNAFEW